MAHLKKKLILLAVSAVSACAAVFAVNWYLGKYFLTSTRIVSCATKLSPGLGFSKPDCRGVIYNPDYGHIPYQTNSLGMRDKKYDESVYSKGRSSVKILVTGDSFTFGAGVKDDEVFHSLAEDRTPDIVYLNGGLGGFGITEEEKIIDYLLPKTNPDMVMVVFLANDLIDLKVGKRGSASAMGRFSLMGNVATVVRDYLMPQKLLLLARGMLSDEWSDIYKIALGKKVEKRYRLYVKTLLRINSGLAAGDPPVPVALLMIPQVEQVNGFLSSRKELSSSAPFDHIRKMVKGSGIVVLDSLPHFLRQKSPGKLYYPRDRHLVPEGHRVLADYLGQKTAELKAVIESRRKAIGASTRPGSRMGEKI
ncbi:SGNH/GDSL hydrolase family protein [Nitrospinota bacterium]